MALKIPKGIAKPIGGAISKPQAVSQYGVTAGSMTSAKDVDTTQGIAGSSNCPVVPSGNNPTVK